MLRAGEIVADRFLIEAVAGSGAMGVVHRANDAETGATVAVKVLRALEHAARFEREARVLATLAHPRIVRYRAHGILSDGIRYLVTDWIEGPTLASRLEQGPMSLDDVWTLGSAIADSLAFAHAADVVHRDVKPSNILLPDGDIERATLVDFGVARWSGATMATASGVAIGTPAYMAPEQARGDRNVDARADVFAAGCVLYECLAGRAAFFGPHALAVLARVLFEEAPPLESLRTNVPSVLTELLRSTMAKERAERPSNGMALKLALESARWRSTAPSPRPSLQEPAEFGLFSVVMAAGTTATSTSTAVAQQLAPADSDFGGRAEVLADGTLLVLFSAAPSATDLAVRSANCALEIHAKNATRAVVIATGLGDRARPWPIGEAIDKAVELLHAQRLHAEVEASVRIDETTAQLLDGRFDVSRVGGAWMLCGVGTPALESRLLLGRSTLCVGRDRELSFLESIFEECGAERLAHVAILTAPPGMGKSRVRFELHQRLAARPSAPGLWTARGQEIRSSVHFGVVSALLHSAVGADPLEPLPVRRAKIDGFARALGLGRDEPRALAFLFELAGVEDETPCIEVQMARRDFLQLKELLTRVWVDVVATASANRVLVLIIDDAHWADAASMDLLDIVLHELREKPIFALMLGRPETDRRWAERWSSTATQHIQLPPLPRRACEALACEVLGQHVSPETIARVVDRSAGNAFFLEELIRAAAEGRDNTLPASVLAMVQARIDAQSAAARRLLRSASVLGMTFTEKELEALLHDGAHTRDATLRQLVTDELLSRRSFGNDREERKYVFRHALLREAAYAMLPDGERAELHERAAQSHLVDAEPARVADAAEHLERAARLWSGLDRERAARLFADAAKLRQQVFQMAASLSAVLSALDLGDLNRRSGTELLRWLQILARAAFFVRAAEGLSELFPRVLTRLDAAGSKEERVHARVEVARALGAIHEFNSAYPVLVSAGDVAGDTVALRRAVRTVEMELTLRAGDFRRAVSAADALRAVGVPEDPHAWAFLAFAFATAGRGAESKHALTVARTFVNECDIATMVEVENLGAVALIYLGELAEAVAESERVAELAERVGLPYVAAVCHHNRGDCLQMLGRHCDARTSFERSFAIAQRLGSTRMVLSNEMHLAYLDGLSGDRGAVGRIRALLQEKDGSGHLVDVTDGTLLLGMLLRHSGDSHGAVQELGRALSSARMQGNPIMERRAEEALSETHNRGEGKAG